MTLPQIRLQPWYPGQFGVRFSDVQRGLRWEPSGIVLYVDNTHANTNDDNDGTNPDGPLKTIQAAVDKLLTFQTAFTTSMYTSDLRGSVIVVAGHSYEESVTIGTGDLTYCTLLAGGPSSYRPNWASAAVASPCLSIQAEGWVVDGFQFQCPASAAGILLTQTEADTHAYKTTVQSCIFDGLWAGKYGIEWTGAPHRTRVLNNWFVELDQEDDSAFALYVSGSTFADPFECEIAGNRFTENDNHVGSANHDYGFNLSLFRDNVFEEPTLNTTTLYLDLRGGSQGDNIVTGNYFGAAYTNAGGYYANAGTSDSHWMGNMTEATPGTVGDNGLTVRVPA